MTGGDAFFVMFHVFTLRTYDHRTHTETRMLNRKSLTIAAIALATTAALFAQDAKKKQYDKAPEMKIDVAKTYTATIETNKGKIVVELFAKDAPQTTNSFVFLARDGFYDGTIFHRVIPGFMIQGGDPTGTGRGGPGYQYDNENQSSTHGFGPGTLAMANAGPGTNGSQFFIVDGENAAHLPAANYTIFGEVKSGQDVVHAIATAPTRPQDRPAEDVVMTKVTVEEK